jgi:hypothetical protein
MIEISTFAFFGVYIYILLAVGVIHEHGHLAVAKQYDKSASMSGFKTTFLVSNSQQLREVSFGGVVAGLVALFIANELLSLSLEFWLLSIFWYLYLCKGDLLTIWRGR